MSGNAFRVVGKPIYFSDALSAQEYAKKNPGVTITRINNNQNITKKRYSKSMIFLKYTPESILEHLNKSIIAQDEAKKEIAITLYYHYLRVKYKYIKPLHINKLLEECEE